MLGGAPGLFPYLPALESRLLSASATEVGQDLWTWCPLPPAERTHSPVGLLSVFGRERLENSLDAGRNWDDWGKLLVGFGASSDTQQGEMARWAMVYEGAKWHRSDLVSFRKSRLGGSQPLLLLPAKPPGTLGVPLCSCLGGCGACDGELWGSRLTSPLGCSGPARRLLGSCCSLRASPGPLGTRGELAGIEAALPCPSEGRPGGEKGRWMGRKDTWEPYPWLPSTTPWNHSLLNTQQPVSSTEG